MTVADAVKAFTGERVAIEEAFVSTVDDLFDGLDFWDSDKVTEAACDATEISVDAQREISALVDEFLADIFDEADKKPPKHTSEPDGFLRGDAPESNPVEVWQRPSEQARYAKSVGRDPQDAASLRAGQLASQDLGLAQRNAEMGNMATAGAAGLIVGYRRVLRPEMSREGTCGLCVVAATRMYQASQMKPLHNGCWCLTMPAFEDADPGFELNSEDLGAIYAAAGGTGRDVLQRTRVTVRNHGELGPVLVRDKDGFTTEAERAVRRANRASARVVRARLNRAKRSGDALLTAIYDAELANLTT